MAVEYDPETSYGKIVKYDKKDPEKYETVGGLIQGRESILKKLRELQEQEPNRKRWGYYWKWVKRDARQAGKASKKEISPDEEW